jgi:hypothetical protein
MTSSTIIMTKSNIRSCGALLAVAAAMAVTGVDAFAKVTSRPSWMVLPIRHHDDDAVQVRVQAFPNQHEHQHQRDLDDSRPDFHFAIHNNPTTSTRRDVVVRSSAAFLFWGALSGWLMEQLPLANVMLVPPANAVLVTDPHRPPIVPCADSIPSFVSGTVTLPVDFDLELAQAKSALVGNDPTGKMFIPALYVTVRPDRPDNVPQAILAGTRGKSPPVLSARFENPTFPFAFHLTPHDYTPEGKPAEGSMENGEQQQQQQQPWWWKDDLVVSARLDMDGIAATRSPEDLVGRAIYRRKTGGEAVQVALMGRGAFGKFATTTK